MEKKSQIYLSAFIMYLVVGFAGYINQFSNYWMVLVISLLIAAFTLTTALTDKETFKDSKIEWISVCAFLGLEVILTVCIAIAKVPYVGFFRYFNYGIQLLGFLFAIYSIISMVVKFTKLDKFVGEKISSRKSKKTQVMETKNEEVATKVEETIASETAIQDANLNEADVEVVGQATNEVEVVGIEYTKEEEVSTPYMEEEL